MIIDNTDDFELFYNDTDNNRSSTLSVYLLFNTLSAILFMTRDHEAATRYTGSNVINIDKMDNREARELLQRSLYNKQLIEDIVSVTTLQKLLVNLLLIIIQAAIYLNAKSCTITEYLRIYKESSDNVIKLLSKDFKDIRRYLGIKNLIATT
jgi:hypothetical protein